MDQLDVLSSPFLRIPAAIFMVIGLVLFVRHAYAAYKAHPHANMHTYLELIGLLYMIGLGCKFAALGPEFARYHLTDIGFPVAISHIMFSLYQRGLAYNEYFNALDRATKVLTLTRYRRNFILIALGLSYAYEIGVELMYQTRPDLAVAIVGRFDWQDMVMYTIGAGLGVGVIEFYSRRTKRLVAERDAAEAVYQAAARANAKEVSRELRKEYVSNKRRSRRK